MSQIESPGSSLSSSPRRPRLALLILALGLASVAVAWGIDRLRTERLAADHRVLHDLDGLRIELLSVHLLLEEELGDGELDPVSIREALEQADQAYARLLEGHAAVRHRVDCTLPEPMLAEVGQGLEEVRELSENRMGRSLRGEDVGLDSPHEEHYDEAQARLLSHAVELAELGRVHLETHRRRSERLLVATLLGWAVLVCLVAVAWQLHDRRRALLRASLEESRRRLFQAQKMEALGRMAGGIAHDINNHLATIRAHGELVQRKDLDRDRLAEKMERILDSVLKASSLIERLLGFGHRRTSHPEVVDLNHVIEELEKILRGTAGKDVKLELRLAESPLPVRVDVTQIEQVLANLVVNARDAIGAGGRIIIETALASDRGEVRLSVADDGPGIAPEIIEQIFDPFFTTKQGLGGTGLGLATVYALVEEAGGRIEVDSEMGHGTRFLIHIPRCEEATSSEAMGSRQESFGAPGEESILLVDDNEELGRASRSLLEDEGYRVTLACDFASALDAARKSEKPFDAVITDVRLGESAGPDLVASLREIAPVPALYMSGYTDRIVLRSHVRTDEAFFLKKPFSAEGLLRMLRELIDSGENEARDDLQSVE